MNSIVLKESKSIPYFSFPLLEACQCVQHGFSTRLGGVSEGDFATMNLGYLRGDNRDAVYENFCRMAGALNLPVERMVAARQTHTVNVKVVNELDAGKGITRETDFDHIDGLVTNVPDLPLVTFYADCVPLYFVDPVKRVIGLSHSGWRGTVERMGAETLKVMKERFECRAEDVLACIGPCICKDCYEVGEDVAKEFLLAFSEKECALILSKPDEDGKYQLDLPKANELILKNAGIRDGHLSVSGICTCCNSDLLFSHRASKGRRGNLAAFLSLV